MNAELRAKAIKVLNQNAQEGGFTIPTKGLYPFQWKWDSGFIAIGLAHFDKQRAEDEISSLLDAQWGNGFIPHIVFHTETDTYFPGPEVHQSERHPQSPKDYKTTGLTQPPVLGFVLERLYQINGNLEFVRQHIDSIFENHKYFYKNRDINKDGLVYIYHNWESGTDNSPMWDEIWEKVQAPEYSFERKDTTHVNPAQRPSKREYDHYIHIIEIAKKWNYDDASIAIHSPFLVIDPLFNAMLIRSNEALIALYTLLGGHADKIEQLRNWQARSLKGMNEKLFDKKLGAYVHYDLRNDRPLSYITSSSFAPLFAGIPSNQQAELMFEVLRQKFGAEDLYMCASFDPTHSKFNSQKYWRGPVWINLNWILYHGLRRYKAEKLAERIKKDTLELVSKFGYCEYFDPIKKNDGAYGGENFSWSAALTLDLLAENNQY